MLIESEQVVTVDEMKTFIWHTFDDIHIANEDENYFRVIWQTPTCGLDFECLVNVDKQQVRIVHCRTNTGSGDTAQSNAIGINLRDPKFYEKLYEELDRDLKPEEFFK